MAHFHVMDKNSLEFLLIPFNSILFKVAVHTVTLKMLELTASYSYI